MFQRRSFDAEKQAKRVHERHVCDLPVTVWSEDLKTKVGIARARNISMGGVLLECPMVLQKGSSYHFQIAGAARITVSGQVVRETRVGGSRDNQYGISFSLSTKAQNMLKVVIDPLRAKASKPPIEEDKLRWYWGR